MTNLQDVRKSLEASLGNLNAARAQELAKGMLDTDAAKEQVAKVAADLVEWSQRNRTRMTTVIRTEVRDQLRQMGVVTEDELNALRKRVRDLERASRASGAKRTAAKTTAAKTTAAEKAKKTSAAKPAAAKPASSKRTDAATA